MLGCADFACMLKVHIPEKETINPPSLCGDQHKVPIEYVSVCACEITDPTPLPPYLCFVGSYCCRIKRQPQVLQGFMQFTLTATVKLPKCFQTFLVDVAILSFAVSFVRR